MSFAEFNVICLLASLLLGGGIARALAVSRRGFLIGVVAGFVNVARLEQAFYLPVSTDYAAFALGFWLVLAHLRGSVVGIAAVGVLGAFTWPVAVPAACAFLCWPYRPYLALRESPTTLGTLVAGGVAASLTGLFAYAYYVLGHSVVGLGGPLASVLHGFVPLSLAAGVAFSFIAVQLLLRGVDWRYVIDAVRRISIGGLLLGIAILFITRLLVAKFASPTEPKLLTLRGFASFFAIMPFTRPLTNVVAHTTYLGPVAVCFMWPAVTRQLRARGTGAVACAFGAVLLLILPESRQSMFTMPLLLTGFVLATERLRIPSAIIVGFLALSLAMSKVWMSFGPGDAGNVETTRRYFMHHGPWMTNRDYALNVAVTAGVAFGLYLLGRRMRWSSAVPATAGERPSAVVVCGPQYVPPESHAR